MTRPAELPVVVVGGGIGGLSAATALVEQGRKVILLESAPQLGGRARSWRDEATGDIVDNGQHLFMACYRAVGDLLRRIRVPRHALPRYQPMLHVPFVDCDDHGEGHGRGHGRTSELRLPPWPAPLHLLGGLRTFDALSTADRLAVLGLAPAILGLSPPDDSVTVDEWLTARGQSSRAKRALWTPITLAALNEEPEVASAALLVGVLREAFAFRRKDASLGAAPCGLSELYVDPAVHWLRQRGASVLSSTAVERLVVDAHRGRAVQLANGDLLEASAIVLAVPPRAVGRLTDPTTRELAGWSTIDSIATSPIVSVHLWLDRQIDIGHDFVALLGSPIHWVFDRARIVGGATRAGSTLSLVISAGRKAAALGRDELLALSLEELARAFDSAKGAKLVHGLVIREKHATISPAANGYRLRPDTVSGLSSVYVAGDWTKTGLPATLEGAARSGHAAAAAIGRARTTGRWVDEGASARV